MTGLHISVVENSFNIWLVLYHQWVYYSCWKENQVIFHIVIQIYLLLQIRQLVLSRNHRFCLRFLGERRVLLIESYGFDCTTSMKQNLPRETPSPQTHTHTDTFTHTRWQSSNCIHSLCCFTSAHVCLFTCMNSVGRWGRSCSWLTAISSDCLCVCVFVWF